MVRMHFFQGFSPRCDQFLIFCLVLVSIGRWRFFKRGDLDIEGNFRLKEKTSKELCDFLLRAMQKTKQGNHRKGMRLKLRIFPENLKSSPRRVIIREPEADEQSKI